MLMDISMPGGGVGVLGQILARHPMQKIVMLKLSCFTFMKLTIRTQKSILRLISMRLLKKESMNNEYMLSLILDYN